MAWKEEIRNKKAGEKHRKVAGSVLRLNDYIM